jgi:hypothetical protein
MSDLIEQAERNIVNVCRAHEDIYALVDALTAFGNKYVDDWAGGGDFFKGIQLIRQALNQSLSANIRKLFSFAGVGGEAAQEYSREQFCQLFANDTDRYNVMHLLDQYARVPRSYNIEMDVEFRKQGKELCNKWKEENKSGE